MATTLQRDCPICGGRPRGIYFPYATRFNGHAFQYLKCASCATVFVDPVPDNVTFEKMYAKADYHDHHYDGVDQEAYQQSVRFLARHLPIGKRILDYGCGTGSFLAACSEHGYIPVGVDFDRDVARAAGERARCEGTSVTEFEAAIGSDLFDAIHLGDVLEHLPDPLVTLTALVGRLRAGGVLFVEGPIEVNPSPVYWAARIFGVIKRIVRPDFLATHPPTHLLRTNALSQMHFFSRFGGQFELADWTVEETGWPYRDGGLLKRAIARLAGALGGRHIFGVTYGNRFKAVLLKRHVANG